jgi:hypothetical protein
MPRWVFLLYLFSSQRELLAELSLKLILDSWSRCRDNHRLFPAMVPCHSRGSLDRYLRFTFHVCEDGLGLRYHQRVHKSFMLDHSCGGFTIDEERLKDN